MHHPCDISVLVFGSKEAFVDDDRCLKKFYFTEFDSIIFLPKDNVARKKSNFCVSLFSFFFFLILREKIIRTHSGVLGNQRWKIVVTVPISNTPEEQ